MYFWRIQSLKRDLAADAVTEADALPYLLWVGGVASLSLTLPSYEPNGWDLASSLASVPLFIGGTWWAFRCNGGRTGERFLVRYIALNWVVAIRLLVLLAIPGLVLGVALEELIYEPFPTGTTPVMAAFFVLSESVFYWRVVTHIRDVGRAARAA